MGVESRMFGGKIYDLESGLDRFRVRAVGSGAEGVEPRG